MANENGNGWDEYQKLVLSKLDTHEGWLRSLTEKQTECRIEIAALKAKAGAWGAVAAIAVSAIVNLFLKK